MKHAMLATRAALAACCLPGMMLAGAARSLADQERLEIDTSMEMRHTIRLEAESPVRRCHARFSLDYLQKNTIAAVNGRIENDDCAASSGTWAISIRYRSENGEMHSIRAEEPWSRENSDVVEVQSEHFIGENADLIRVSARKVDCVCTDDADSESEEGNEQ